MGLLYWSYTGELAEHRRADARDREAQEQLRHCQKIEAFGQLAAGVAHEFNNLLVGIVGNAEILLTAAASHIPDQLQTPLRNIHKSGNRAAELTRQLLSFSRKKTSNPEPFDANRMITDGESMLQRLSGQDVTLKLDLDSRRCVVDADEG